MHSFGNSLHPQLGELWVPRRRKVCLVLSCRVVPCLVLCCLVLSCLVLSCVVLSCLALLCLALSCLVFPCLVLSCLVLSCLVLSCLRLHYKKVFAVVWWPSDPKLTPPLPSLLNTNSSPRFDGNANASTALLSPEAESRRRERLQIGCSQERSINPKQPWYRYSLC